MLILTRRCDEAIVIGEDIAITVLAVRGSRVRLGIDAPQDTRVYRSEIRKQASAEETFLPPCDLHTPAPR